MKIFKSKVKLKEEIIGEKNISFIPTMGGLHKGHLSLIKKSKTIKGKILVSIFINPKQFNVKNDFIKYPRNIKSDLLKLKRLNVDYVFLPSIKDIFNFSPKKKIFLDSFSKRLCGKSRIGHFEGVLNVINRFLDIINPKYIYLGLKDYQQLVLIKKHILKRKINTRVISCKTVRERNGVACSTRNKHLSKLQLLVASMGGNAGMQTLAVTIRAIAKKELSSNNFNRVVGKEFIIGILNGIIFAIITAIIVQLWFKEFNLSLLIGISMILNMIVAGLFGILVPVSLKKINVDPALASSVFVTTITDVIGFLSFLGLGSFYFLN